jgi:hypothetical protein
MFNSLTMFNLNSSFLIHKIPLFFFNQRESPTVILLIVQAVLHACPPSSFAAVRGASLQTRLVADQQGAPGPYGVPLLTTLSTIKIHKRPYRSGFEDI